MKTHLEAKDGSQGDLPAAVEVVDIGHKRQRRRQPGIRTDAASIHSPEQSVQGDRASPEAVRAHLYNIKPSIPSHHGAGTVGPMGLQALGVLVHNVQYGSRDVQQ